MRYEPVIFTLVLILFIVVIGVGWSLIGMFSG